LKRSKPTITFVANYRMVIRPVPVPNSTFRSGVTLSNKLLLTLPGDGVSASVPAPYAKLFLKPEPILKLVTRKGVNG
jgi:hypothetical protein